MNPLIRCYLDRCRSRIARLIPAALCAAVCLLVASSCKGPKDIAYFQDFDTSVIDVQTEKMPVRILPDDKLLIVVSARNQALAEMFNLRSPSSGGSSAFGANGLAVKESGLSTPGGSNSYLYYTVDQRGNIEFPELGELHIAGMTRSEVSGYIKGELAGRGLLNDAVVTVEIANAGINVLGEVNSPGRYNINRDNITLLDALATAGDLTINGQRGNVLVVRTVGDKRETYRIDLTDGKAMLASPGFNLQQGDIVYVEPNSYKKRTTTANGNNVLSAPFWLSVASFLTTIAVLIFK